MTSIPLHASVFKFTASIGSSHAVVAVDTVFTSSAVDESSTDVGDVRCIIYKQ